MAKKENFQEYVTRTQNEIAGIESKSGKIEKTAIRTQDAAIAECYRI